MHPVDLVEDAAEGVVLEAPPREYTRRQFLTNIWKTGNYLRTLGVNEDSLVAITADPTPETLLSFFGASLLDARVRFAPPADVDARVVVGPTDRLHGFELPPGGQYLGYGTAPDDPAWSYFERDVWSENPAFPDVDHDTTRPLLETEREQYDAEAVVESAQSLAAELEPDDQVALRVPLETPGTIVAGILAPLSADATILLPTDDETGTVAVTAGDAPEPRRIIPDQVAITARRV